MCKSTVRLVLILFFAVLFSADSCKKINLTNYTPTSFPRIGYDAWYNPPIPYNISQKMAADDWANKHIFYVNISTEYIDTRTIKAFITVNGIEYPMIGNQGGLWKFESLNKCNSEYKYFFRVNYESSNNRYLGTNANPFTAVVAESGKTSWYSPGKTPTDKVFAGSGSVIIDQGSREIVIQNLSPNRVRIVQLWFYSGPLVSPQDSANNDQFRILDLPPHGTELVNCGDSLKFRISWIQPPPPPFVSQAKCVILINTEKLIPGTTNWSADFQGFIYVTAVAAQ